MSNTRLHCSEHGDEITVGSEAYVVVDCGVPSRGRFLVCARAINVIPKSQRIGNTDTHSINASIALFEATIKRPTFNLGKKLFYLTPERVRGFLPRTAQMLFD